MTLGLLIALAAAAFVLGIALHVALYAPTAALPPMWRNLARYTLGMAAVLIVLAVAVTLAPNIGAWQLYALNVILFAITGLGVGIGYLAMDD